MNRALGASDLAAAAPIARLARRGLAAAMLGPDRTASGRSRAQRWIFNVCAACGSALLVVAILGVASAILRDHLAPLPLDYTGHWRPKALEIAATLSILVLAVPYPLKAWRLGYLAVLLVPAISNEPKFNVVVSLAVVIAFVNAGLRTTRLVLWSMWALTLVPVWVWLTPRVANAILTTAALTVIAVALDALSATRKAGYALAEQVAQTEHEEERRAVLEERTRIAREMHDVVAHHMSLIAVQAETAPYRLAELTQSTVTELREGTIAEFASLSSAARAALADLRSLLGVLRSDEEPERAPQPRLADVPDLVQTMRRAGVEVELTMPNDDQNVPAAVGLCAYRIVQEALSNARRHAPGSRVAVGIQLDRHQIKLVVTNGPPANPSSAPKPRARDHRAGLGIPGMRERVALLGGSLAAKPTLVGGYAVSATIPLMRA
jgi:signal transduction histidine kinase